MYVHIHVHVNVHSTLATGKLVIEEEKKGNPNPSNEKFFKFESGV